ncbi:MAG: CTP synthase [Verrucomicrobia bacterium]|nr:CTP synthase [Verrucomicrobiota bacterium]MBS0637319.1 CTP synthase [Verrucomicrobiota bacterium]
MQPKFIFITGGVVSSLGKGIAASSIGLLLERMGLKVSMMKLDPYLNVDPGTMSPFQHGEVYVTDDGAETDLDLGHYYRFTHSPLSKKSSVSSGQIYHEVLRRERKGDYLGKTVQVIPHITDEIKRRIVDCAAHSDVILVEIGGTVGDIESQPFLEAIRQMRYEKPNSCLNIHVTYVPFIKAAGEVKTKPTQHSVQLLRQIGISPDMILCRSELSLSEDVKEKISLFCNVRTDNVIECADVQHSIYEVPLTLHAQNIEEKICQMLQLPSQPINLTNWQQLIETIRHPKGVITVGIVGKYVQHQDAYKSVFEALQHGAFANGYKIEIRRIESDRFDESGAFPDWAHGCDGYLVPGGFGDRGWYGKISCAKYCRENKIPYFGICLGMQVMVVEFARHGLGLIHANSTEMDQTTPDPIISLLEEQKLVTDRGGTMRLGAYPCLLKEDSKAHLAYGKPQISERHRHRYEVNNKYRPQLEKAGLSISGTYEEGDLTEIVEVKDHPWMVGAQFHPEFGSKPLEPHPLFRDFVKAMIERKTAC